MAGDDRGCAACHRKRTLPAGVRLLAQSVRGVVRHGGGDRHRHGFPVRHQLERAGAEDRPDPGAAAGLRSVHRLHVGSDVLWRHVARARTRPALALLPRLLHGVARDDVLWILANNSWMQVPLGHTIVDGRIIPADWWAITSGPIMRVRWPHMLLAAF